MASKAKRSAWQTTARYMLADGYGVEDISVEMAVLIGKVRNFVEVLREMGVLRVMFR